MKVALEEGDTLVTDRKTAQIKAVFLQRQIDENGAIAPAVLALIAVFAFFAFWVVGLVTLIMAIAWYAQRENDNKDTKQEIGLLRIAYGF